MVEMSKRLLVGIECPKESIQSLVALIYCKAQKLLIVDLGPPNGVKPRSKSLWDPIIDKFEKKLSTWKKNY